MYDLYLCFNNTFIILSSLFLPVSLHACTHNFLSPEVLHLSVYQTNRLSNIIEIFVHFTSRQILTNSQNFQKIKVSLQITLKQTKHLLINLQKYTQLEECCRRCEKVNKAHASALMKLKCWEKNKSEQKWIKIKLQMNKGNNNFL